MLHAQESVDKLVNVCIYVHLKYIHMYLSKHASTVNEGHNEEQWEDGSIPVEEGVNAVGGVGDLFD